MIEKYFEFLYYKEIAIIVIPVIIVLILIIYGWLSSDK